MCTRGLMFETINTFGNKNSFVRCHRKLVSFNNLFGIFFKCNASWRYKNRNKPRVFWNQCSPLDHVIVIISGLYRSLLPRGTTKLT